MTSWALAIVSWYSGNTGSPKFCPARQPRWRPSLVCAWHRSWRIEIMEESPSPGYDAASTDDFRKERRERIRRVRKAWGLRNLSAFYVLILIVIIFGATMPDLFLTSQNLEAILYQQ